MRNLQGNRTRLSTLLASVMAAALFFASAATASLDTRKARQEREGEMHHIALPSDFCLSGRAIRPGKRRTFWQWWISMRRRRATAASSRPCHFPAPVQAATSLITSGFQAIGVCLPAAGC